MNSDMICWWDKYYEHTSPVGFSRFYSRPRSIAY